MTFANPLPWWAFIAVVACAAALAWHAYSSAPITSRRRAVLSGLRFAALFLLIVLLMRPVARQDPADPVDAVVPILIDTSRSMGIEDSHGARRIDRARELVTRELMPSLSARFQSELLAFGEGLAPVAPDALGATARRSDLTGALQAVRERYRGRAIAGIVLISDGGETTQGPEPGDADGVAPVFAIGVGSETIDRDREVLSVTAAEAVLDDSRVDLTVSAVSHGYGTGPIEMRLLENGRPLQMQRVAPAADGTPVSATFQVSPGQGAATIYAVEIPAAAGELAPENNTRSVLVQAPARPRRVLLVQGAPGFEHSFLRRAWSGDSGLEIDSVVRKGRNEQGSDTFYIQAAAARSASLVTGYPAKTEDLFGYDAIVLANVEGGSLTTAQLEATKAFVARRGGGLLVLGAQSFLRRGLDGTPLEELLPLDLSDRGRGVLPASVQSPRGANRVGLTQAGEVHPIMQLTATIEETRKRWEAVPALASVSPLGGARPGATVLAVTSGPGGTPRALVAVQRYGEGRSLVFTGEASWRWRMMLPASDRSYDTFWRQAVRWLALPAVDPVAVIAPAGAARGDTLAVRVLARDASFEPLRDASVDVRVTRPDGRVETIATASQPGAEGIFAGRFQAADAGIYRLTAEARRADAPAASASTSVLVGGADPEMTDPRLNLRVLQRVAASSGGRLVDPQQAGSLAAELRAAAPAAALVRRDLWHNGWSFLLIVCVLGGEWLLRRRWGLK